MKKKIISLALITVISSTLLIGCRESTRVSYNLSKEADSFNVIRQLTVINAIQGDTLFQMTGRISTSIENEGDKLAVVVDNGNGNYSKHLIGLSDNVTYVVEQLDVKDVSNYKFTLNYNPKMWIPINIENKTIQED